MSSENTNENSFTRSFTSAFNREDTLAKMNPISVFS